MDALLARLERDAEAEIARVLADARARAAAITAEAEARVAGRRQAALARREAEYRAAMERALGTARHAARQRALAAREALLERCFAEVRAALPGAAATVAYRGALAENVRRALAFTGDRPAAIRCAPDLAPALRRLIKTNGRLRIESDREIAAGFRVATADGTLEVDETLGARVARRRPQLALQALAALIEEERESAP